MERRRRSVGCSELAVGNGGRQVLPLKARTDGELRVTHLTNVHILRCRKAQAAGCERASARDQLLCLSTEVVRCIDHEKWVEPTILQVGK